MSAVNHSSAKKFYSIPAWEAKQSSDDDDCGNEVLY